MSVRTRRIENEWKILAVLAAHNPGIVEVIGRETHPDADVFHAILHQTSAVSPGEPPLLMQAASHPVAFSFPAFYPGVPIEAFLVDSVLHPNIHPENGFVCLWDRFSRGDTVVEAIVKLQKIITWELSNDRAEHVMQPEARSRIAGINIPLACKPVRIPEALKRERTYTARSGGYGRLSR